MMAHHRAPNRRGGTRAVFGGNVVARLGAVVALGVSTVLVARSGGPALVGVYALLRVLPGLAGVVTSCGLPAAVPYFLAGPHAGNPRLRPTIVALTTLGAGLAAAGWIALSPVLHHYFFGTASLRLVLWTALPVATQLWVAVGKSCLQGSDDMRGANWSILAEETAFLPVYAALRIAGIEGTGLLVAALVLADVVVAAWIAARLLKRGWGRGWGRPDPALGRTISLFGLRGQVGGVVSLLNLRLDFALLGALSGPAVLGAYSIASKYAELLRMPGLAVTYVLYPRFAKSDPAEARRRTRALMTPALVLNIAAAAVLAAAASWLLPLLYGKGFKGAIVPTWILLAGLLGEGVAGLVTAYLYGRGKPGLNSWAMGAGLVATLALDVLLIPRFGSIGAAVASSIAYVLATLTLLGCFAALGERRGSLKRHRASLEPAR